jgi:hypothetical protein
VHLFDGDVIWCYSKKSAVHSLQLAETKNLQFNEGQLADFENANENPCLIPLDELLNEAYSKDVSDLFPKYSLHRYFIVVLVNQKPIHQAGLSRYLAERKV